MCEIFMKYWPIRRDKWNKMKVGSCGSGLSLWDIAVYAFQKNESGNEINFWGIYFCYKTLDPTFQRPHGRVCTFFCCFFIKQNRKFGKRSNGSSKVSTYGNSKAKNAFHMPFTVLSGTCVGTTCVNAHAYVCIVCGCWQREGRPCSEAGASRLVGLRSQHIHKSGLSGSCQRLHNEGHYSGRVSKLLSQGPVPGNHTHSAPC